MASQPVQLTANKGTTTPRRKRVRVTALTKALRQRIPALFDFTKDDEQLAKTLEISRLDLIAEVLRDTRRHIERKPPEREMVAGVPDNLVVMRRRQA